MSGVTLYIAEKPSMARDIAKVLGARSREGIKWVGDGVWVSWCIGHLVELASPDEHDPKWKSWRPDVLPVLPAALKWVPKKKTSAHLRQLKALIRDRSVTRVVNACDAGREGELIFRTTFAQANTRKPVWRFWVSSLTAEAIRRGLNQLQPSAAFDPLGAAAYCRAEADWLVGMNATRALTARADGLLSLGRVQTPTLAMIVRRQAEIDDFVPEDYWVIEAELEAKTGVKWRAHWSRSLNDAPDSSTPERASQAQPEPDQSSSEKTKQPKQKIGRCRRPEEARAIIERCRDQVGEVIRADGRERREPPPQLYHLTALQQEANRRFGFTAERTLKIAQALYEKHKAISYPRTDSRHLTPDVGRSLPKVLESLQDPWRAPAQALLHGGLPRLGKRYVNAQRVTDHHAIIPTTAKLNLERLDQDERRLYDLVARSLLAALSPPAVDQHMTLEAEIAGEVWSAQGRVEMERGWREVAPPPIRPSKDRPLPYVSVGTPTRLSQAREDPRQTQPPKPFTDATILGAMEHAGRQIEESALREVMKESGLGTPATRANILDTLLRRGYLSRQKKTLVPTEAGKILVGAVTEPALLIPELTAEWERRLQAISDGDEDPQRFQAEVRAWIGGLIERLLSGGRIHVPQSQQRGKRGKKGSRQSSRQGSRQDSTRSESGAEPRGGSGSWRAASAQSKKKSGRAGDAPRPTSQDLEQVVGQRCPRCREGEMIRGQRAWGCNRWREGCRFVVWFYQDGVEIPEPEAARLCVRRKSRLFHEHEGVKYRLVLGSGGAVSWEAGAKRGSGKGRAGGKAGGRTKGKSSWSRGGAKQGTKSKAKKGQGWRASSNRGS